MRMAAGVPTECRVDWIAWGSAAARNLWNSNRTWCPSWTLMAVRFHSISRDFDEARAEPGAPVNPSLHDLPVRPNTKSHRRKCVGGTNRLSP
jgi:hypothetical protein